MQRSVKKFFKNTKIINGRITDIIKEKVQYVSSETNPATPLVAIYPAIPLYVIETERGNEVFPKASHDFKIGDEIRIVETRYFGLFKSAKLENKN